MHAKVYNTAGAEVGPGGYVVCGVCRHEAHEVSRETHPSYAYHPQCRRGLFGYPTKEGDDEAE